MRKAVLAASGLAIVAACGGQTAEPPASPTTFSPPAPLLSVAAYAPPLMTPPRTAAHVYVARPALGLKDEPLLDAFAVDDETGRLVLFQQTPFNADMMVAHPSERFLFTDTCRDYKKCGVHAWKVAHDGVLEPAAVQGAAAYGNPVHIAASEHGVFLQMDDSSTGYAASVAAFGFDPSTGALTWAGEFAPHHGCHCTGLERLMGIAVDRSGRFFFEMTSKRIVTHRILADARLEKVTEAVITTDSNSGMVMHPRLSFVYAVGSRRDAGVGYLHTYRLDAASGRLDPSGSTELPGRFGSPPLALAVDPLGRALYVAAPSVAPAILTVPLLAGVPRRVDVTAFDDASVAGIAVDPLGRFLYASTVRGNDIDAWRIQSDGSLVALGELAVGGQGLAALASR